MGLKVERQKLKKVFPSKKARCAARAVLHQQPDVSQFLNDINVARRELGARSFVVATLRVSETLDRYIQAANVVLSSYAKLLLRYDSLYAASNAIDSPKVMIQIERMKVLAACGDDIQQMLLLQLSDQEVRRLNIGSIDFVTRRKSYLEQAQLMCQALTSSSAVGASSCLSFFNRHKVRLKFPPQYIDAVTEGKPDLQH